MRSTQVVFTGFKLRSIAYKYVLYDPF
jgi:hypothetical protein